MAGVAENETEPGSGGCAAVAEEEEEEAAARLAEPPPLDVRRKLKERRQPVEEAGEEPFWPGEAAVALA